MCGIVGYISKKNLSSNENVVNRMLHMIAHRGPDDQGVWVSQDNETALGQCRLSVIDLSSCGHQPMISFDGRFVLVFNGEIYNFKSIAKDLEKFGHVFKGHSDTEVLLAAITQWGIEDAVKLFNGMFAFALWDKQLQSLTLVRDRIGVKPLYYGWNNGCFFFASELKALKGHPCFKGDIDSDALALYFRCNYIPAPYSIYKNIYKLLPGSMLNIKKEQFLQHVLPKFYWVASDVASQPKIIYSRSQVVDQLQLILSDSVSLRMQADVPVGVFLSGGVDSSLVASMMQRQSRTSIKTFTIGFEENRFNEAPYAKKIANYLHTEHFELIVTPKDAINVIPQLPYFYDEPFADFSQIPTYLVSKLARNQVTVCLSGDGGDELFAGYNNYSNANKIYKIISWMPLWLRQLLIKLLRSKEPVDWNRILHAVFRNKFAYLLNGHKIHKLAKLLELWSPDILFQQLIQSCCGIERLMNSNQGCPIPSLFSNSLKTSDYTEQMMFWDMQYYLPDDILTKVDRASMAVSLEVRNPIIDYRLVEFAWQIPINMKIYHGQRKWPLKELLSKYIPDNLFLRPKQGFSVPLADWMRGNLKPWCEDLLSEHRIEQMGYLDSQAVQKLWNEHISGCYNWTQQLWCILMFQSWLEKE